MLEIIETSIIQDKPPSFPALPLAALLDQPALLVGGEEGKHQVVIRLVGDLEGLFLDAGVDGNQHCPRQIPARVNPLVLSEELLLRDLDLDVVVVEGGVEHDDGEGQDVDSVAVGEGSRILIAVVSREHVHDPNNSVVSSDPVV